MRLPIAILALLFAASATSPAPFRFGNAPFDGGDAISKDREALTVQLALPETYDGPSDRITELQKSITAVERRIAEAERDWLEAQEAMEAAE